MGLIKAIGGAVGGVLAKYVYDSGGMNLFSAKEFYFTSNLLTENTAKYVLNSTTTEVSFTLGNNADKLRFSQDDIKYEIAVECKSGELYSEENIQYKEGVLTGNSVNQTTVTLQNLKMGETYIVTATGRAGYKQVLKAEFFVESTCTFISFNIFKLSELCSAVITCGREELEKQSRSDPKSPEVL